MAMLMNRIFFTYNGKIIESNVQASMNKEPNYFWCYLKDAELINELGKDCILLINSKGVFKTPHYYPIKYKDLIYGLERSIKQRFDVPNERLGNF